MSIEVSAVSKYYGAQKALDNVSFSVGKGSVVGFLGPNGAGKSTMMRILTSFIPPTDGRAVVCGFDAMEQPMEVKRRVGYLPEHNPLYLDMYVLEYLEFVAGLHQLKKRNEAARTAIDMVGLGPEKGKKIGELSKGYRQRVGLAQAMIHRPEVLIMDEPTTGLDPNQITEIRNLIKEIGRERTVMLSTHIMQEVEAVCDRVIIINKGVIATDQSVEALRQFAAAQAVRVEFDKAVAANLLSNIKGVESAKRINDTTWLLLSNAQVDVRPAVFEFAVANSLAVLTIQREEQRIEDVFKKLTA